VYTHAQVFLDHSTTPAALLRGPPGVHGSNPNSGTSSLLFEQAAEHPQGRVMSTLSEVRMLSHESERQIFNRYQPVAADKLSRFLVPEVPALVRYTLMQLGDLIARFLPTARTLSTATHAALSASQLSERTLQPTGVLDKLPSGKRQKRGEANVNPHAVRRHVHRLSVGQLKHEADVPLVQHPLDDNVLDHRTIGDGAVVLDLDLTDVLNVEHRPTRAVKAQLAAVPVAILDALEAVAPFEARITRHLALFVATVEGAKSFVQTPQKLLQAGRVQDAQRLRVGAALIPKVRPLLSVGDASLLALPGVPTLRQRRVVDVAGPPQETVKGSVLGGACEQPVVVGAYHLGTLLGFDVVLDSLLRNAPGARDEVRTRPQRGQPRLEVRKLSSEYAGGVALELVRKALRRFGWVAADEHVNVVGHDFKRLNRHVYLSSLFRQKLSQALLNLADQDRTPVLGAKNKVVFEREYRPAVFAIPSVCHVSSISRYATGIYKQG